MVDPNSGATATAAATPTVAINPATGHVFINRTVNTTSNVATFTITNTGQATLQIGAVTETGPGFTVATTTCSGVALAPTKTCTVGVTFTPPAVGSVTG